MKKNIHAKVQKYFKCESCGKSFSRVRALKTHNDTTHNGHEDFKCEFCGKSSSVARNLKKHIYTIYEGHKDYKCDSVVNLFLIQEIWRNMFTEFIKAIKIINVSHVVNNLHTFKEAFAAKIFIVNPVENHFLEQEH